MDQKTAGWLNGFAGVLIFSGSLPATRVAVMQFDPVFLTVARASIAGLVALALLMIWKQGKPDARQILSLAVVALGVVIGFPLLTALALKQMTSAHSIVFIGLLPLATALFGVLLTNERPKPAFWLFSIAGSLCVAGFALTRGFGEALSGDGLMIAAVVVCGLGYAEGGRLSRTLGGWQVICWSLVLSLPFMLAGAVVMAPSDVAGLRLPTLFALGYVSLFSMLIGFIFWYRGLAQGGIAAVGQLQLLQPFFGLALASVFLGEQVTWSMVVATLAVIGCVAGARRFAR